MSSTLKCGWTKSFSFPLETHRPPINTLKQVELKKLFKAWRRLEAGAGLGQKLGEAGQGSVSHGGTVGQYWPVRQFCGGREGERATMGRVAKRQILNLNKIR